MAYNIQLADRVREYLARIPGLEIEEKKMFGGLAFLVNGKMCVNVSRDNLMCRFHPGRFDELAEREGFVQMVMKGKSYKGYGYVEPRGIRTDKDLAFWIGTCLEFNEEIRSES
ncbi:MAG TPA: TfoX/Sxy family protein [Edaphocola sp.]|nr:TfoX/Sxy family protein [Edaphocola sp.]